MESQQSPTAKPTFDLNYALEEFEVGTYPDSQFIYQRVEEALLQEAAGKGGRTLDVACGVGKFVAQLQEQGTASIGLEPSLEMSQISRQLFPAERVELVRGIAEVLPFRDGSFDRVICQGSLDHFVDPTAFMCEAARVLRPGGQAIIALANYGSLSCHIGRLRRRMMRALPHHQPGSDRPYWQPPPDHHHRGDLTFVQRLGNGHMKLEHCYGISLLWLVGRWGSLLNKLPDAISRALLVALDRIARRRPALADMIVSAWRPRELRAGQDE